MAIILFLATLVGGIRLQNAHIFVLEPVMAFFKKGVLIVPLPIQQKCSHSSSLL